MQWLVFVGHLMGGVFWSWVGCFCCHAMGGVVVGQMGVFWSCDGWCFLVMRWVMFLVMR